MGALFEVKQGDKAFYEERLKDFLPEKLIDAHTHVWRAELMNRGAKNIERTVSWPGLVAKDNPIEDLLETYKLMFPGKQVTPMIFCTLAEEYDSSNKYVRECAKKHGFPSLIFSVPEWNAEEFEERVVSGGFFGAKSYLGLAPEYLPTGEIRIFDFFPHHQLEVLDAHGWVMMLHIPREKRLRDPVNLAQMVEIDRKYPNIKLIIAHVGRAYCNEDVGDAFEVLAETKHMNFDISANCNEWVFEQLIRAVGPKRILFGSDLPILRMRTRRICENGMYINLVPGGLYGDVSADAHMREVEDEESERLTFFMYEEIDAFRRASEKTGLSRNDVEDVFYRNAAALIRAVSPNSAIF